MGKKPLLTNNHLKIYMEFVPKHVNDTANMLQKVLLSNETKIELFDLYLKRRIWHKSNTAQQLVNTTTVVMVAGTMKLVRFEGKMDDEKYRQIVEEILFNVAKNLEVGRTFTF